MAHMTRFLSIDLSNFDVTRLGELEGKAAAAVRDIAYVTIGFGVLGVQQAQVRRRELMALLGRTQRAAATVQRHAWGLVTSSR